MNNIYEECLWSTATTAIERKSQFVLNRKLPSLAAWDTFFSLRILQILSSQLCNFCLSLNMFLKQWKHVKKAIRAHAEQRSYNILKNLMILSLNILVKEKVCLLVIENLKRAHKISRCNFTTISLKYIFMKVLYIVCLFWYSTIQHLKMTREQLQWNYFTNVSEMVNSLGWGPKFDLQSVVAFFHLRHSYSSQPWLFSTVSDFEYHCYLQQCKARVVLQSHREESALLSWSLCLSHSHSYS